MNRRRLPGAAVAVVLLVAAIATAARAQVAGAYDPRLYLQPPGAGVFPPNARPGLAARLAREAQDLITATRYELAGTLQGQRIEAAARFLAVAATRLSQANQPGAADRALYEIDQAQNQIHAALSGIGGGALPRTDDAARRVDRLIFEIARLGNAPPAGLVPTTGNYNPTAIAQQAEILAVHLSAAIERIVMEVGPQYPYDAATRGLDAARAQASQLVLMTQRGASLGELRGAFESVRAQVAMASRTITGAGPTPGVAQALRLPLRDLAILESLLALNPGYVVPDRPVLIDPPAYPNLPYPIAPPAATAPPRELIALIDEALATTDAFLAAIQPGILSIPEGPQFLADGRQMLVGLSTLRQAAFDPNGPHAMRAPLQRVLLDYDRLQKRTQRVAKGRLGPNIERVFQLGDVLAAIRRDTPAY